MIVDEVPSDGVYCNTYNFDFAEPAEDTLMRVYFNEDRQVIKINMHSNDIDFHKADGSMEKVDNTLYPTAVSFVLLTLDADIDWEQISNHLHEEWYETTVQDYVISNHHSLDHHFYIADITKNAKK